MLPIAAGDRHRGDGDGERRQGERHRSERGAQPSATAAPRALPAARIAVATRAAIGFAAGMLLFSASLSVLTYQIVRGLLVNDDVSGAVRQAGANANAIRLSLGATGQGDGATGQGGGGSGAVPSATDYRRALALIPLAGGAHAYVLADGTWQPDPGAPLPAGVPIELVTDASRGTPYSQVYESSAGPAVAVALPLPGVATSIGAPAVFVETFPLAGTETALEALGLTLAFGVLLFTLIGAVAGRWAANSALRPLRDVAAAASAIAEGRLDTRLPRAHEGPLAMLVTSFNRMADRLSERIRREVRFTSDVSHELRSPLNTLANAAGVLRAHRDALPPSAREAVDLVDDEVDRFQRMVVDLLEISRLDAGAIDLQLDEVRVGEFVRHCLDALGLAEMGLATRPEAAQCTVRLDKRRMERVIANLVENARNYGGGVRAVAIDEAPGIVEISVSDSGPGIPLADRERVFERFYRGPEAGRRGVSRGTGLGLTLVAEHVRRHGGTVHIEEAPAGGARVVIRLPKEEP